MTTRSMRLQVLIEPKLFLELDKMMKEQKIKLRSDSEMVRHCLNKYLEYESTVKLTVWRMKGQLDDQKAVIDTLNTSNTAQRDENNRLIHRIDVLEQQLVQLKRKKKSDKKKEKQEEKK